LLQPASVEDAPGIINGDKAHEFDLPGLGVYVDHSNIGTKGEGHVAREIRFARQWVLGSTGDVDPTATNPGGPRI
jgi:hypothetical protein